MRKTFAARCVTALRHCSPGSCKFGEDRACRNSSFVLGARTDKPGKLDHLHRTTGEFAGLSHGTNDPDRPASLPMPSVNRSGSRPG